MSPRQVDIHRESRAAGPRRVRLYEVGSDPRPVATRGGIASARSALTNGRRVRASAKFGHLRAASDATLIASDVSVHFDGIKAVDGVDLTLRRGEILGVIGPNGAGKTTLVNALSGFLEARPRLGAARGS